jgi:hypothetical protein
VKSGKYVIESIENGLVKLLLSDNEMMEEVVKQEEFLHPVKTGDIVQIKIQDGKLLSTPLPDETQQRREQAKALLEKLKNNKR